MTVQKRDKAVQAVDVLNDFIGDLVGGTNLFRYWESKAEKVRVPKDVMLNVRKICLSHLVLSLHKFVEFYKRFKPVIPSQYSNNCKALVGKIEQKGVREFRDKCVGHIWDEDQGRPLMHSEIKRRLEQITGGDISGFLNWIDNPTVNEFPSSVVSVVETVRDALKGEYSITPDEIVDR